MADGDNKERNKWTVEEWRSRGGVQETDKEKKTGKNVLKQNEKKKNNKNWRTGFLWRWTEKNVRRQEPRKREEQKGMESEDES